MSFKSFSQKIACEQKVFSNFYFVEKKLFCFLLDWGNINRVSGRQAVRQGISLSNLYGANSSLSFRDVILWQKHPFSLKELWKSVHKWKIEKGGRQNAITLKIIQKSVKDAHNQARKC